MSAGLAWDGGSTGRIRRPGAGPVETLGAASPGAGYFGVNALLFATDYPHRHDDDITQLLSLLSPAAQRNLMSETAREWYRL